MLERLIAFDTTSRNSNLSLIAFVEEYLSGHGVATWRVPNADETKSGLIARIGPDAPGGVVLSGHSDVVPVDGQAWSSDPFTLTQRGTRVFGRGTSDMKSFAACVLALVPELLSQPLTRPLLFVLSYDEEIGCLGASPLAAALHAHGFKPSAAIIGEPSSMRVVNAHKGIRAFHTEVTGHEAHSSNTHKGVSAVMVAAELIMELKRLGDEMAARGDASGRFDPPFTSVQASVIRGGTALNILAKQCRFSWEYRSLPDTDEEEVAKRFTAFAQETVLPRMRAISPDTDIVTVARSTVPALRPLADSPAETLALSVAGQNGAEAVSYGTEAGIFQNAGIPSVICGPGDIAQAHSPDEFIEISQIESCTAFLKRLGVRLSA